MAATLACGDGALLSHRDAAALWELRPASASTRVRRDGALARRAQAARGASPSTDRAPCTADDVTTCIAGSRSRPSRARCSTSPRRLDGRRSRAAIEQAGSAELFDLRAISTSARAPSSPAAAAGSSAPCSRSTATTSFTRSDLEAIVLALCDAHALPAAARQPHRRRAGGRLPLARPARSIVETDGRATHVTRAAFERDRARDATLLDRRLPRRALHRAARSVHDAAAVAGR